MTIHASPNMTIEKNIKSRIRVALTACLLMMMLIGPGLSSAHAQEFPSRPVKLLVPYPPGGTGDFVARLYAGNLSKIFGKPIVVINRAGASTNLALEDLSRADADGYTLMEGTSQTMINTVFGPTPSVDSFAVVTPIALVAETPFMIAANPDAGIGSAKDMVAKAKAQRLTIGHAQFDGQIKLLKIATGADIESIPYKGGSESVMAALSGEVSMVGAYVPALLSMITSGKLRAVGVASKSRMAILPDVPTFSEQGYPKFTTTAWLSILAPKGVPANILQKLTTASLAVAKDPNFAERLQASGAEPLPRTPDEALMTMHDELKQWTDVESAK